MSSSSGESLRFPERPSHVAVAPAGAVDSPVGTSDLKSHLAVLRRRKWWVALIVVLVVGTVLFVSSRQPRVYESRARLLLTSGVSIPGQSIADAPEPFREKTEIEVLESEPVRAAVRERIPNAPRVKAIQVGSTSVLELVVQSFSPGAAADVTDAYAEAYIEFRHRARVGDLEAVATQLRGQLDALQLQIDERQRRIDDIQAELNATPTRDAGVRGLELEQNSAIRQRDDLMSSKARLTDQLNELKLAVSLDDGGVRTLRQASVPSAPVQPDVERRTFLGLGMGLLLGVGVAFLVDHFDESLKTIEDLEATAPDLPVLGVIPAKVQPGLKGQRLVAQDHPQSPAAEAYRTLHTALQFRGLASGMTSFEITSPAEGEGKSTVVANLAVSLAQAGERVVMIDCDLRHPTLHTFFGLPNSKGFVSMMLHEAPLASVIQRVPGYESLLLLASGPATPDPVKLLRSAHRRRVLDRMQNQGAILLVDAPPVLPVTDAVLLSASVEATLLVVRAAQTTRTELNTARELLEAANARVLAAVFTGVTETQYPRAGYYRRAND